MKKTIIIITAFAIGLASCKKEEKVIEPTPKPETTGTVKLHTMFNVNGRMYHEDSVYMDDFSHKYKFSFVNIYMSHPTFMKAGVMTMLPTKHLLIKPETMHYSLGKVEAGHYHMLKMNVGVDSLSNHTDPNTYAPSHPLYPQSPNMHWAWSSGYIFYRIEGVADIDNNGTYEQTFAFHIGMDKFRKSVQGMVHTEIKAGKETTLNLKIDLSKFLTNVDLATENVTHTMDNMPLAMKVAGNSPTAFTISGGH